MSGKRQIFALLGSSKVVAARGMNKFQGKPGVDLWLPVTQWQWKKLCPYPLPQ